MNKKITIKNRVGFFKEIQTMIRNQEIERGFVVIQSLSSKSIVFTSANDNLKAVSDFEKELSYIIPSKEEYLGNNPTHTSSFIKSGLVGTNLVLPFEDKELIIGRNQELFAINFIDDSSEIVISIN